jgi:cysteine desulfurase
MKKTIVYLDNNATTLMCDAAVEAFRDWERCYNPSSGSKLTEPIRKELDKCTQYVHKHIGTSPEDFYVLWTSGATESNCTFLRMVAESYKMVTQKKGHIISSSIEHHSILEQLARLHELDLVDVSLVSPNHQGIISPKEVEACIVENTCLIAIMHANNELGTINPIKEIGAIAHKHSKPFFSDCVQTFGKFKMKPSVYNLDALSASAHKFYGPKGVGLLIIKKELVIGYEMKGIMSGTQQYGLRGGTENVPGIIATTYALKEAFKDRDAKNRRLVKLVEDALEIIERQWRMGEYSNYVGNEQYSPREPEAVVLGPADMELRLPNTILIAFAKPDFCNVEFKRRLETMGIIVSISSACLTKSAKASHVLYALEAPTLIKRGVIRISFSDDLTAKDMSMAIRTIAKAAYEFEL